MRSSQVLEPFHLANIDHSLLLCPVAPRDRNSRDIILRYIILRSWIELNNRVPLHRRILLLFAHFVVRHYLTMGLFSSASSQPAPPPPAPSQDGGFIAPDRTSRAKCWEGRDSFFQCLERNGIIDSVKEDEKARKACPAELRDFESVCASSWVGRCPECWGVRFGEITGCAEDGDDSAT